ncbi:MAG: branched-chain amino acid ABC transporter substrate-binding protein [Anaerolineae bacterium]|nr:branched-chain amino acid ABC transporter substrate-binding protein [Anaerolineae bacterium]
MKHSIVYLMIVVILLAATCQTSPPFECTDAIGCITLAPGVPLKLGAIQDLSGGAKVFGVEQINSLDLAVAAHNEQLLGHPIEIQIEDEACSEEGGANATLRIVADPQMVGIFGTTCSSAASAAGKIMSESGLVMISGANSAASLTSMAGKAATDWHPGYYRTMLNVVEEARAGAVFAFEELNITRAATIDDGDVFSQGYAAVFKQAFIALGGEIVADVTVNKGDVDMHPALTTFATAKTELIFFALFPQEGIHVVQQAKEVAGLEKIIFLGGGALRTNDFIKAVGQDGIGMYFIGSSPPLEGPANDKLVAEYEAEFGSPPQTVTYGYGYDAATLLLHAIETVAIAEKDGTLHIGWQALRDALYATSDFEGVMGSMTCDTFGDCAVIKFDLVQLEDPALGVDGLLTNVIYTYTAE